MYASTVLFDELQDSMNTIWEVERKVSDSWWGILRHQLVSLVMVVTAVLLFLVSLVLSTFLPIVNHYAKGGGSTLGRPVEVIASLIIFTVLFATIFKLVPDATIAWRDVWIGAAATGSLFTLGKYLIGIYLARSSGSSIYGATGAVAVLLVWVYYSAHVFFIGAEFTQVFARRHGRQIEPGRRNEKGDEPKAVAH